MSYLHPRHLIHQGFPTRTTTGTRGSTVFESCMLTADNANRGWCGFAGAGNTSSVDVDKVGVADSLTGAKPVMVMVIAVVGGNQTFKTRGSGWGSAQVGRR
jgi:hypothetical protein